MGGNDSKPKKKITKMQIEICALKVREYLNLNKDRKSNQVIKEQKRLVNLINASVRNKQEEYIAMEQIVNILKYLNACRILMSYAEVIKNSSGIIVDSNGELKNISELLPYIQGLIYSTQQMNLNALAEFKRLMLDAYGVELYNVSDSKLVSPELKQCFARITPTFRQINVYILEMCQRNQISLEKINAIGHKFQENVSKQEIIEVPNNQGNQGFNGGPNYGQGGQGFNNEQKPTTQVHIYPGSFNIPQQQHYIQPVYIQPQQGFNQQPNFNQQYNNQFNPQNYMPVYQPQGFNQGGQFQGMYVPNNGQIPAYQYPQNSTVYDMNFGNPNQKK